MLNAATALAGGRTLGDFAGGSRVVALYFAAAWCPDCVRYSPKLKQLASDAPGLPIVFVSSDRDASSIAGAMKKLLPPSVAALAFDDPLRNELKRRFGACAGSEQRAVGVDPRVSGIPTLILIKWPPLKADNGNRVSDKQIGNAGWRKGLAVE